MGSKTLGECRKFLRALGKKLKLGKVVSISKKHAMGRVSKFEKTAPASCEGAPDFKRGAVVHYSDLNVAVAEEEAAKELLEVLFVLLLPDPEPNPVTVIVWRVLEADEKAV